MWRRNQSTALELAASDKIVSPTKWQKDQLPKVFKDLCIVIPDGVNLNLFNPKKLKRNCQKIITYGTRGMEPMRCFENFIRALPKLLYDIDNVIVQIAGGDGIHYGGRKPEGFMSWHEWAVNFLKKNNLTHLVEWKGRLKEDKYIEFLKNSSCHVYLTHPFVASWSLGEAIACGIPIVGSDIECVKEFEQYCLYRGQLLAVDHRNITKMSIAIKSQLQNRPFDCDQGASTSDRINNLGLDSSMDRWKGLLNA